MVCCYLIINETVLFIFITLFATIKYSSIIIIIIIIKTFIYESAY